MHINKDGSKIMRDKDQKIIHRWNYKFEKSPWTTESSKNVGDVLDSLKLGLDNKTTPDSLMHTDIGKSIGHGSTKTAYKNQIPLFINGNKNAGIGVFVK
jgi:hypothetical protein